MRVPRTRGFGMHPPAIIKSGVVLSRPGSWKGILPYRDSWLRTSLCTPEELIITFIGEDAARPAAIITKLCLLVQPTGPSGGAPVEGLGGKTYVILRVHNRPKGTSAIGAPAHPTCFPLHPRRVSGVRL